jgi:cytochrome b561
MSVRLYRRSRHPVFHLCHRINGILLALAVLLHLAAVIYHQFVLRDSVLNRMLPKRRAAHTQYPKQ